MATIRVSIINESKLVTAVEVQAAAAALQRQVSEHFAPAWGVDAALSFVAAGAKPLAGSWWLVILDDSDQAGALGYHDLTDEAMPLGKVFVKTAQDAGVKWTITASHELLELLADPAINLTVCASENNNLVLYAYEICDPCQADEFGYAIDGVIVSDFLFPSWFETFHRAGVVPLDYCGRISTPFTLLPGGYANVLDTGHPAGAWTEKKGPAARIAGTRFAERPVVPGSRRERHQYPARTLADRLALGVRLQREIRRGGKRDCRRSDCAARRHPPGLLAQQHGIERHQSGARGMDHGCSLGVRVRR